MTTVHGLSRATYLCTWQLVNSGWKQLIITSIFYPFCCTTGTSPGCIVLPAISLHAAPGCCLLLALALSCFHIENHQYRRQLECWVLAASSYKEIKSLSPSYFSSTL